MRWDEMNRDMWLPCMQHDLVTYPRKCMTWHDKRQAGSWVSRIPYREQVQVHASTNPSTTSSVASSGNIGRWGVAPLLTPFDSGFPTHTHTHPIPSHPIPSPSGSPCRSVVESAHSEDSRSPEGALSATLDTKLQVLDAALADLQRELQTCHLDVDRLGSFGEVMHLLGENTWEIDM